MAVLGDSGGSTDDSLQFLWLSSYQMRTLELTFIVSFLQKT